jgi:hypothetical protein
MTRGEFVAWMHLDRFGNKQEQPNEKDLQSLYAQIMSVPELEEFEDEIFNQLQKIQK